MGEEKVSNRIGSLGAALDVWCIVAGAAVVGATVVGVAAVGSDPDSAAFGAAKVIVTSGVL